MLTLITTLLLLLTPPLTADSQVDDILSALQQSGTTLRDFSAKVGMEEMDNTTGAIKTRTGQIWYDRKPDGQVRMRLTLDKLIDDRGAIDRKIEYLLKDGWLIDRDYNSKIEVNRQVLKPGEKIDLLKLGEGPFPLPIGQDPTEVHRQFNVTKLPAAQDVPEEQLPRVKDLLRIQLTPKPDSQFARDFASIDVWIHPADHFPRRIMTTNETTVQTTDLQDLNINQSIPDKQFVLEEIPAETWNRRSEPFK